MIKKGDLVMVGPMACCGTCTGIEGTIFTVTGTHNSPLSQTCNSCGHEGPSPGAYGHSCNKPIDLDRLKKLDPPSEGETREAYVNLKQPRKVTA